MTGNDRSSSRAHPTPDELADLREELLDDDEARRVHDHVAGCAECAAELAAIDEVAALLREAGGEAVTMPAAVARSIDAALGEAAAEGDATPAAAPKQAIRPRRREWARPAFGWLAAAAAAVVVIGGIGAGLRQLGESGADNAASGGTSSRAEANDAGGAAGSGDYSNPPAQAPGKHIVSPTVDERNLGDFAANMSRHRSRPKPAAQALTGLHCVRAADESADSVDGAASRPTYARPVQWHGITALVVVSSEPRVASVYSCETTPRLLYSTAY